MLPLVEEEDTMTVIMPTIVKYQIKTPDQKTVLSEHEPDELETLRKLIEGTDNIIQYVFKELPETKDVDNN
jgi:hypothetical protein